MERTALSDAIYRAVGEAAVTLRPDVREALERAVTAETSERARSVLRQLIENAAIAASDRVPVCQDTGTAWVRITLPSGAPVPVDLQPLADEAVAAAYRDFGLRASTVRDALLDRSNPGDNTPAFLDVTFAAREGARVEVMLKGGGSDNASVLAMLPPSAGLDGVRDVVLSAVEAKATGACPPLLIGVAVGGTFDTVGTLAKKALLRSIGSPAASEAAEEVERMLLREVNATGIGPAGLGGATTALAVHLVTAPCHIAALPVAINMGCCAVRSAAVEVVD